MPQFPHLSVRVNSSIYFGGLWELINTGEQGAYNNSLWHKGGRKLSLTVMVTVDSVRPILMDGDTKPVQFYF